MNITLKQFFMAFHGDEEARVYCRIFCDYDRNKKSLNRDQLIKNSMYFQEYLKDSNSQRNGIFFVVNGGGQSDKDINYITAQFMEMDNLPFEEQWKKINAFALEPSIIVKTAKSLHCYWLIKNGKIETFKEVQELLIEYFGSDKNIKNLSRVMRLPNFYHHKEKPILVECVKFKPQLKYTQKQLIEELGKNKSDETLPPPNDIQINNSTIEQGERSNKIYQIAAFEKDKGSNKSQVLEICLAHNKTRCRPPLNSNEVEQIVNNAFKYAKGEILKRNKQIKLNVQSVASVMKKDIPPLDYIIEEILPQGLAILAAPPKAGKSYLSLDACLHIAHGLDFLGRKTNKCGVLYLALEDSDRRLKKRITEVWGNKLLDENYFYRATEAPRTDNGLIDQLSEHMDSCPHTKLIVIDTLQKTRDNNISSSNVYGSDYSEADKFKSLADKYNICVLLIHHFRKMDDNSDVYMRFSGTSGLTGSADTLLALEKDKRFDKEATLSITGRDVEPIQLKISFDADAKRWKLLGTNEEIEYKRKAENYNNSSIKKAVLKLLESKNEWNGTISEFVTATQIEWDAKRANVLSKELKYYFKLMLEVDKIKYTPPSKSGRVHKFEYI